MSPPIGPTSETAQDKNVMNHNHKVWYLNHTWYIILLNITVMWAALLCHLYLFLVQF